MNGLSSHNTKPNGMANDYPKPVRALPASWYRSNAMFQLERRAIFSKRWLMVSHTVRFLNAGDYLHLVVAGFSFFLVKGRDEEIYAHHNVCRHRGHPLVEQESGKLAALACKYHGWSYRFNGSLAKAPQYQELPSFDKSDNGLFRIHTYIDRLGFIWVNLDSSDEPALQWDEAFTSAVTHERFEHFNMEDYHFDHQWNMTCKTSLLHLGEPMLWFMDVAQQTALPALS
ncbi:hypothetical protein LTR37_006587 [Vermiconidia calcicola]|uniref:Uncharacterized protein n=1 Tax=Vermiconidia calcicola TaxID=1690605 RepID=A0ACC3NGD4_9PEZI|nr:hypothetical protein LTR37_006587 [Vermiconidia calcicola]